ncbi:MAG: helix-turn-helix transcriptional regulator [Firmicutes bacterium]|nr:helix-turn-helix transcriptional regulator [Bacillota bacterium]
MSCMRFSEKLLQLRKRNGFSQEELADRLGVSRQAISRWEMGTAVPDSMNLLQISKVFGVSTDYLLNDDYESDNDIPKVKESNKILQSNLTVIAIICQMAFLNAVMRPLDDGQVPYLLYTKNCIPTIIIFLLRTEIMFIVSATKLPSERQALQQQLTLANST